MPSQVWATLPSQRIVPSLHSPPVLLPVPVLSVSVVVGSLVESLAETPVVVVVVPVSLVDVEVPVAVPVAVPVLVVVPVVGAVAVLVIVAVVAVAVVALSLSEAVPSSLVQASVARGKQTRLRAVLRRSMARDYHNNNFATR